MPSVNLFFFIFNVSYVSVELSYHCFEENVCFCYCNQTNDIKLLEMNGNPELCVDCIEWTHTSHWINQKCYMSFIFSLTLIKKSNKNKTVYVFWNISSPWREILKNQSFFKLSYVCYHGILGKTNNGSDNKINNNMFNGEKKLIFWFSMKIIKSRYCLFNGLEWYLMK